MGIEHIKVQQEKERPLYNRKTVVCIPKYLQTSCSPSNPIHPCLLTCKSIKTCPIPLDTPCNSHYLEQRCEETLTMNMNKNKNMQ